MRRLTLRSREERPDPGHSPAVSDLPASEMWRWINTLNDARREYKQDGNAARRFFDSGAVEDLIISMGLALPRKDNQ